MQAKNAQRPPPFDVRCVTADYASASGYQACAFAKGRVTLAIRGQGHARAGPTPNATTTDTDEVVKC